MMTMNRQFKIDYVLMQKDLHFTLINVHLIINTIPLGTKHCNMNYAIYLNILILLTMIKIAF